MRWQFRLLLATKVLLWAGIWSCPAAVADESDVYESLADVYIGRVFLSPQDRARLDAGVPAAVSAKETTPAPVVKRRRPPAGYFVSSSGAAGIWARHGFVAEDDVDDVVFPGAVEIVRTRAPAAEADKTAARGDDD